MPVFFYDPPDRFVAGAVGQPGERVFYLQATARGRVTSVVLEKYQVSLLAERIDELLDEVLRRTGGSPALPAVRAAAGRRRAHLPAAERSPPQPCLIRARNQACAARGFSTCSRTARWRSRGGW